MSILLYLPAIGIILVYRKGLVVCGAYMMAAALLQALVAQEFLLSYPGEYLTSSFDFSRAFLYKWTVNWKFLDEATFLSRRLSTTLLLAHLTVLFAFAAWKWCRAHGGIFEVIVKAVSSPFKAIDASAWNGEGEVVDPGGRLRMTTQSRHNSAIIHV
jgi:alpha-1,3-mannosyltransferase